ncbi:hypothetical protein L208DRAFT_1376547 [Tricholoma matsutake]|nr:hypothetical protein L208DRAFT_1376547 [Tricholoma matsutake 945]
MDSTSGIRLDSHKLQHYEIRLPVEIWLEILSQTDKITIRSVTLTCSTLRWIAQPLLFKLLVISLRASPLFLQSIRRDVHSNTNIRARLSLLGSPHLARAIEELRIHQTAHASPSLSFDKHQRGHPILSQANDLITILFTAVPSLSNLKRLVCHDIVFTSERLQALTHLSQLTHLELHSCCTSCPQSSFPNFSLVPLETLIFDYPYSSVDFFHNPRFLCLLLQPSTLKHICTGPASDIILALTTTPALSTLTTLEIPISTLSSSLILPALASCPSVSNLALHTIAGHNCLPQFDMDSLPADVLPLLSSYRGPRIYVPVFARGRVLSCIDLTLSCQPDDLVSTILKLSLDPSCTAHTRIFTCKVQHLDTVLLQTIHSVFPSLTHLSISGAAVDIHVLNAILLHVEKVGRETQVLRSIELCVQMGLPRPTLRWRKIGARMFLERLVEAYPELQRVRLVCQPDQAVVWRRPLETCIPAGGGLAFGAEQLWFEKQEGGGGGFWEIVKKW